MAILEEIKQPASLLSKLQREDDRWSLHYLAQVNFHSPFSTLQIKANSWFFVWVFHEQVITGLTSSIPISLRTFKNSFIECPPLPLIQNLSL